MKIKSTIISILLITSSINATELHYAFPSINNTPYMDTDWWDDDSDEFDGKFNLDDVLHLEDRLNEKILGQPHAVQATSEAILRFAAGIRDPKKPIATLLFAGPTGVGKTELAKQLAAELFGSPDMINQLNMSEYVHSWSASRLIGSPPGYIDSYNGGQLTNALLRDPSSIILLDEIDKAHPEVLKVFLQVFDEGTITSAMGKEVNCKDAIFILTTNYAANSIIDLSKKGLFIEEIESKIEPIMMDILSPELYNRLDLVLFTPMQKEVMEHLVLIRLHELHERVFKAQEILLEFDESLIQYLIKKGYSPNLGARPLKSLIEKELTTLIAKAIIQEDCSSGDTLFIRYESDHIIIDIQSPEAS